MSRLLFHIIQRLGTDKGADVAVYAMIDSAFQRIVRACPIANSSGSASDEADAELQPLLQFDAELSASVRERMLEGLRCDPPLHGLLHACIAAAHCDGTCAEESTDSLQAGVQPGADIVRAHWLRGSAVEACARGVPATARVCACRRGLLLRLVGGPDWAEIAKLPRGTVVPVAAQPPGTPGRRFVFAARLQSGDASVLCAAPQCQLTCIVHGPIQSLLIETHTATGALPHTPIDLHIQLGVVFWSVSSFARLARAADAWVRQLSGDPLKAFACDAPAGGGHWVAAKSVTHCQAAVLQSRSVVLETSLGDLSALADKVGYATDDWEMPLDRPVWVCVWGMEAACADAS